jgi:pregnancy-associated plasma protein-A
MSVRRTVGLLAAGAISASVFAVLPVGTGTAAPAQSDVSGVLCETDEGSAARVRPGSHVEERNDVSPAEAAAAEKDLRSRLAGRRVDIAAVVTIPVVFHVVHAANGQGNVTDSQITRQIAEMNQNFAGGESSQAANTEFQFTLQSIRRWQNDAWFNDPDSLEGEAAMKTPTRQGDAGVLNIWSANSRFLGYATFPSWYAGAPQLDGVVIQYGSLPGGDITNFNLGKTASHEVGHWLGLFHTFEAECDVLNDMVADTPAQFVESSGCPVGKDTCPAAGRDPIHNYMDYSHDSCYNQFTQGQKARMQDHWAAYRA